MIIPITEIEATTDAILERSAELGWKPYSDQADAMDFNSLLAGAIVIVDRSKPYKSSSMITGMMLDEYLAKLKPL
jgi:hypothetical protein